MARYFDHTTIATPTPANPSQEIIASLTNVTGFPLRNTYSKHDLQGLYSGPTSISYLYFHFSKSSSPDLLIAERKPHY
ncbi:hypothetical protein ABVK25_011961 [Lepraria finkii]|uniref:Uncharacterized protein n=1 Tax=Lepraria finkii TaxID=1340010 RepID=A0ABR4AJE7_9LECA